MVARLGEFAIGLARDAGLGETVLLDSLLSGLLRIHMIAGKMDQTATLLGVVNELDCPLAADDPLYIRLLICKSTPIVRERKGDGCATRFRSHFCA